MQVKVSEATYRHQPEGVVCPLPWWALMPCEAAMQASCAQDTAAKLACRRGGSIIPRRCAQAFLGEVATWTGIVTGTLMFASPALFARWKWRGVAGATPAFMLWTGLPFFLGCVAFSLARLPGSLGGVALRALVIVGAILQARPLCAPEQAAATQPRPRGMCCSTCLQPSFYRWCMLPLHCLHSISWIHGRPPMPA